MVNAYGPAEQVLMATVARRYFLDGRSKTQIADALGISRFRVARLLDKAQAVGFVRIEISSPARIDVELSAGLIERYGLRHAVVLATQEVDESALRTQIGAAAADLLTEIVQPGDVLGLAWARSLSAMGGSLATVASCDVVQLTGVLRRPDVEDTSIDLVRDVARLGNGAAHYYHAPMIVDSAQTAAALRQQPEIARTISRIGSVTVAFVGIGAWEPAASTVFDSIPVTEQAALHAAGVRAEISGVLLDAEGSEIEAPLAERIVGITAPQLRQVETVVGVAYGEAKTDAVRCCLVGGWVSGLVTHDAIARGLLARH